MRSLFEPNTRYGQGRRHGMCTRVQRNIARRVLSHRCIAVAAVGCGLKGARRVDDRPREAFIDRATTTRGKLERNPRISWRFSEAVWWSPDLLPSRTAATVLRARS